MQSVPGAYVFGDIEVRPQQRQLVVRGEVKPVGARAFDLLVALVERRGRLVDKSELFGAVWPGMIVEDNNIVVQVGNLRKVLGAQCIVTVPGRGYRFVVPGDAEHPAHAPAPSAPVAAAAPAIDADTPPLIGRDAAARALGELLGAHRLVTLCGTGGAGKTSLARRIWQQHRALHEHGGACVELDALPGSATLVETLAASLELPPEAAADLPALVRALRPLSVLLLLDNAEHMVDEVAQVVRELLAGAPGVRLLVASQVPLRLAGERVLRLRPLSVPPPGVDVAQAMTYGAVELFVLRAQAADAGFRLTDANVAHAIDICRRLDGLPLAIELAAARAPLLGVAVLASAVGSGLRLPGGRMRDLPPRQRTLQAAMEWSHGLLSGSEQVVFRRLAVFGGSFALDTARDVAARPEDGLDEWTVLDALSTLLDRSLIMVEEGCARRLRLLGIVRAFAQERLSASGEDGETRVRHARAMRARLDRVCADHWAGRLMADAARELLAPDLNGARDALACAVEHDAGTAVGLLPGMVFALGAADSAEVARLLDATAPLVTPALPAAARAAWHLEAARVWRPDGSTAAMEHALEAAQLYRTLDDRKALYRALAAVVTTGGAPCGEPQRRALQELRALEEPSWPAPLRLVGAQARAWALHAQGDGEAARAACDHLLLLAERTGDSVARAQALELIGELARR